MHKDNKHEGNLIERFEASYNRIDHHLRLSLNKERDVPFTYLVGQFCQQNNNHTQKEFLLKVADLRNLIIHTKTKPHEYIAIPSEYMIQKLERIAEKFGKPTKVFPKFRRTVVTVKPEDTLAQIFKLISNREYSQFPVYGLTKFKGLLTENGITRWVANHVAGQMSLVDLEDVNVRAVLRQEEKRKNWDFTAKDKTLEEVQHLFSQNKFLEAVLITQNGKPTEKLLGIVTRWDLLA